MPADALSSHTQRIFIPPAHFLKVIVQRGTIIIFIPGLAVPGVPIIPAGLDMGIPGTPMPVRSIMIAEVILVSFRQEPSVANEPHGVKRSTHCPRWPRISSESAEK
jgi:hypothetical protein